MGLNGDDDVVRGEGLHGVKKSLDCRRCSCFLPKFLVCCCCGLTVLLGWVVFLVVSRGQSL